MSVQASYRPRGFQEVKAPRFPDNRHIKVVRLSALHTGRLNPQEIFLILTTIGGWVEPRVIAERITSMKNSIDTIGNRIRDLSACSAVPQPTFCSKNVSRRKANIHRQLARLTGKFSLCWLKWVMNQNGEATKTRFARKWQYHSEYCKALYC